jgi:hypothetical protein
LFLCHGFVFFHSMFYPKKEKQRSSHPHILRNVGPTQKWG